MGNLNKPVFDAEDISLLKAIARHGFVDMGYIYKFYKPNRKKETVMRRIKQLAKWDFIHIEKMFEPSGYTLTGKEGYAAICLDREGHIFLRVLGYEAPNYKPLLQKAAPYRIYHQVQVATVCDSLELAYKERDGMFVVDRVLNERDATLSDQENQPDAMLLFRYNRQEDQGLIAVFLEMERSYARWQRIEAKLDAYVNAVRKRKYQNELGLPIIAYRVLFVSETISQYDTLRAKIELCESAKKIDVLVAKYFDVCNRGAARIYQLPIHDREESYGLLSSLEASD